MRINSLIVLTDDERRLIARALFHCSGDDLPTDDRLRTLAWRFVLCPPGTAFAPDHEQHKDAAVETRQGYSRELLEATAACLQKAQLRYSTLQTLTDADARAVVQTIRRALEIVTGGARLLRSRA